MKKSGNPGEVKGAVLAQVEAGGDKGHIDSLRRAEEKAGIKTGARFIDGKEGVVSFLGYPKPRFYFQLRAADGTYGEAREITKADYDRTHSLRL